MIVSNGSGGVHIEGRVAELFAEYASIGMEIMRVAIEDGVAESTLREVMKVCCRIVLDHWEDFGEEQ